MNFVLLTFLFWALLVVIVCTLIITLENKLPATLVKNFKHGKVAMKDKTPTVTSKIVKEVPKSWFKQFYLVGLFVYAYGIYMVTCTYIFNYDVPKWFGYLLDITCGEDRVTTTSATKTYIAFVLLTLQVFRRCYDTQYISVFGKSGRMGISYYLIGLLYYPGCALAILCEGPKFARKSLSPTNEMVNITNISTVDIVMIIIFLWAWWNQHVATKILANMRKDDKGAVVSDAYKVPHGHWFKYLTAPHQTTEIIMYFSLAVLLWTNFTWFFVFFFVLCNQTESILLTHWWYKEKFEDFPKNRKALIPFVY